MRILLAVLFFALSPTVFACSFVQPQPMTVDPSLAKKGDLPPPSPKVTVSSIHRGNANDPRDSCGDTGVIVLEIPASRMNRRLLYSFEQVSGTADDIIFQSGHFSTVLIENRRMYFVFPWLDGATDSQEPLNLVVRVTPYLQSGLAGKPIEIRVNDSGR